MYKNSGHKNTGGTISVSEVIFLHQAIKLFLLRDDDFSFPNVMRNTSHL